MVPRSETKAKIVVASWDNKTLVGTIKLRFRDGHDIWNWTRFVTKCYFPESKSWKKPLAEKPCWQTKGNVNMTKWMISPPQQPAPYRYMLLYLMKNNTEWTILIPTASPCEVRLFELAVIGTILSVAKNNTGTGKLGKLFSGRKASGRKWKSENETENPNTSYLAEL